MGLFKKKTIKQTNQPNQEKLDHGELPFGWTAHHRDWFKPKDDALISMSNLAAIKNPDQRIKQIQFLIEYFNSYRKEAHDKGECFEKYFEDMWMHCHNSRDKDFPFIKPYEEELAKLKGNR